MKAHRLLFTLHILLPLLAAWSCASTPAKPGTPPRSARAVTPAPPEMRIVGYYASWGARSGVDPAAVRGELLTHINYAFANVSEDGRVVLGNPCLDIGVCDPARGDTLVVPGGNFAQLLRLKKRHPHLKMLMAIGGWSWSENFSDAALTPESRRRFVSSAIELFLDGWPALFDGFDLDWEFPVSGGRPENSYRPEDRENYTLLAAEFRRQLDERGAREGRRYLLTIAGPAGPRVMANLELGRIQEHLDWINVMTYDYHTAGRVAHFNAPLYAAADDPTPQLSVHATVQGYLAAGVPREKIVVGVPFFGYGYGGVPAERDGLFQPAERNGFEPASGATREWGVGAVRFRQLGDARERGFGRFWHPEAQVPWLYNPETQVWISYDDAQSLALKSDYVREHGLGGVMIWELGGDDGMLLETLHRRLRR